jgi:hypothetical protein
MPLYPLYIVVIGGYEVTSIDAGLGMPTPWLALHWVPQYLVYVEKAEA